MDSWARDLRLAWRGLVKAPAFALLAVLTLGLGVGANTAIFSVVDAVLLRPLPFPQPQQLLSVREADRTFPSKSVSYPDYLDWVADNHSFAQLAVYREDDAVLTHAGPPAVITGEMATWQYFPALGIQPELGRTFAVEEDKVGAPDVVVLADSLWHDRFGADPTIVGRVVELDSKPRTVIGVMPAGFPGLNSGPTAPQFWTPLGASATKDSGLPNRGSHQGLNGLGRLKPGATLATARADMGGIARALAQQYPKSNTGEEVTVVPYLDRVVRNDGPTTLWILLAAVGMVLLIACANVANLMLARATTRQKANAVRAALGASRARLIREHLAESLWLGVAGSGLGLGIALLAMRAVPALLPSTMGITRATAASLDGRVLAFTAALALGTSLLFGIAPAWHASRTRIAEILKEGGRETAAGGASHRLRGTLVALEMALALLLLAGAGLLIRSLLRLQTVDPGFNPRQVLSFHVGIPEAKYTTPDQSLEFFRQAEQRLRQLPGVTAVGEVQPLPFGGSDWENSFSIVGRPAPAPGTEPSSNYAMVGGDYFRVMQMRLLRGRAFNEGDTPKSMPVAIIDDSFARRYWPGTDPLDRALGQRIQMGSQKLTIVGVAARVMDYGLDQSTEMDKLVETFVPRSQVGNNNTDAYFVVRSPLAGGATPLALRGAVTRAIQAQDADQPVDDMLTMEERVGQSLAGRRLTLWLLGAFAALALVLAAVGVYGVLSYAVAQRAHEIGIRMTLGADAGDVRMLVMRQGLKFAVIGAAAGLALALPLSRMASSMLYGVSWHDPVALALVPAVLLAVSAGACYLPARRATRVDPCVALRGE